MAFAAWTFAGCSQDDTFNESPTVNQVIEFGTYVGRDAMSRAEAATVESLKESSEGFGVFAYYTGESDFSSTYFNQKPNFMNNQQVVWTNVNNMTEKVWEYSPGKYWPNYPEKLSFFAYAPYDKTAKYGYSAAADGSNPKNNIRIPFKVKNNIADQKDLLYATELNKTKPTDGKGKVQFTFKHALSRIAVTAQYAVNHTDRKNIPWTATTVSIKKIKLTGCIMGDDGTFNEEKFFFKDGDLEIQADGTIKWWEPANTEGKQSFTWDFTSSPRSLQKTDATNAPQPVTNDTEYLMIIPWRIPSDRGEDDYNLYVNVEYTVETTDPAILNGKSKIDYNVWAPVPKLRKFEAGKAYKLNLKLAMDWVDAEAGSVAAWEDATIPTDYNGDAEIK